MINSFDKDSLKRNGKATETFYFKRFAVKDGRSTMKVGTDAVLLGAAVDVTGAKNILEIGTGCGVIALMLAQRSNALIDAIDIDEESVDEAKENVLQSPWKDRVNIIHDSLQDHARECGKKYDLIVSNPPYFSNSLKSPSQKRNISRHDDSLGFESLVRYSDDILMPSGSLWLILPTRESENLLQASRKYGFSTSFKLEICSKEGCDPYREIIHIGKIHVEKTIVSTLAIKDSQGAFVREYTNLTNEFYLDS